MKFNAHIAPRCLAYVLLLLSWAIQGSNAATPRPVPNGSFELPAVPFVSIEVESWRKSARPDWYEEGDGFLWSQLTGIFRNPAPGSGGFIDNCDGNQALWLFAVPEVALHLDDIPGNGIEAGKAYRLQFDLIGGGGGMSNGVILEVSLDAVAGDSSRSSIATLLITNSPSLFPSLNRFVSFTLQSSVVPQGDATIERRLGITLRSRVDFLLQSGYWDIDRVQLLEVLPPRLVEPRLKGSVFQVELAGEVDEVVEIVSTQQLRGRQDSALFDWTRELVITNTTGNISLEIPWQGRTDRFFQARRLSTP